MDSDKLMGAIGATAGLLKRICDGRSERLTVLGHLVAAELKNAKMNPDEVAAYLVKITKALDGEFDR